MKRFTLLVLSILLVFATQAQLFNIGGFGIGYIYVGPKLGGNASYNSVDLGAGAEKTANYGYQFGGVGKFGITKKLAIQPELVFSSKGYAQNFGSTKASANYKYFGVPVVAKYAFAAIAGIDIYGSGGFYTDVLTGVEVVYSDSPESGEEVTDLSPYSRVDFGLNFGGGANIPFKNKDQLNIDLRVTYGLTETEDFWGTTKGRSTSIQLSAVYLLDLTKFVKFKGSSTNEQDAYEENNAPAGGSKVEREED